MLDVARDIIGSAATRDVSGNWARLSGRPDQYWRVLAWCRRGSFVGLAIGAFAPKARSPDQLASPG